MEDALGLLFIENRKFKIQGLHRKFHFDATPFGYVRMSKKRGVENEGQGGTDANDLARIPSRAMDWTWWLIDCVV